MIRYRIPVKITPGQPIEFEYCEASNALDAARQLCLVQGCRANLLQYETTPNDWEWCSEGRREQTELLRQLKRKE